MMHISHHHTGDRQRSSGLDMLKTMGMVNSPLIHYTSSIRASCRQCSFHGITPTMGLGFTVTRKNRRSTLVSCCQESRSVVPVMSNCLFCPDRTLRQNTGGLLWQLRPDPRISPQLFGRRYSFFYRCTCLLSCNDRQLLSNDDYYLPSAAPASRQLL